MKILCTADWHIGKKLEAFSRLDEQKEILQQLITLSHEQAPDVVLVAGDCFDTQNPTPEMSKLFIKTLAALSRNGECLVLVIAGNHDNPVFLSSSEAFASQVGVVIVGYSTDIPQLESEDTPWTILYQDEGVIEILFKKRKKRIRFLLSPYANAKRLKKDLGTGDTDKKAWEILQDMWAQNLSQDEDVTNILVTHYFVQAEPSDGLYQEELEEDESERATLGTIGSASLATVPDGIDYVILGHIHRPYSLYSARGIKAFYTGSPLPYSVKETGYQKSVLMLDLKKKSEERIPLSIRRTIKEITFDSFDNIFTQLAQEQENYVLLRWVGDRYFTAEEHRQLRESHPRILRIESYANVASDLDTTLSPQSTQSEDPKELFEEYYFFQKKQQAPEDLLEVFGEVLSEEREQNQDPKKQGFYPKKLSMKGFYSYKEETEIDFSQFDGKHFFGVFGATGSGKSALVEAMIFALFGKVERLGEIGTNSGKRKFSTAYGMMNLTADEMKIDFEFEIYGEEGKEEYRFLITAKRKKKEFDSVGWDRTIFIKKGDEWEPMDVDKDDKSIGERLLGIPYDDFRKTIILQQRDFDGFLNLGNADRTKILKNLFQLHRFDLSSSVDPLLKNVSTKIEGISGRLIELKDVNEEGVKEFESLKKTLEEDLSSHKKTLQMKQAEYDNLKNLQERQADFEKISQDRDKLLSEKDLFDQAKQRNDIETIVKNSDKINALSRDSLDLNQKISQFQEDLDAAQTEIKTITLQQETNTKNIQDTKANAETIKTQEDLVTEKLLDISEILPRLEQKLTDYDRLNDKKSDLNKKITDSQDQIQDLTTDNQKIQDLRSRELELKKIDSMQSVRAYLREHEPCPLCGSMEHPNPCEEGDYDQELKILEDEIKQLDQKIRAAETTKALLQDYLAQASSLDLEMKDILAHYQNREELDRELREKLAEKNLLSTEKNDCQQKRTTSVRRLDELEREKADLDRKKQSLNEKMIVLTGNIQNSKDRCEQILTEIEDLKNENKAEITRLNITKEKYESIREYPSKAMDEIQEYFAELQRLNGQYDLLKKDLSKDIDKVYLEQLEQEVAHLLDLIEGGQKKLGSTSQQLEKMTEDLKKKIELEKNTRDLELRQSNLENLRKLFLGDKFVSFVAQKYLKKLCYTANHRFIRFTKNQFELVTDPEKSEIFLIDRLSGGNHRDISTLSGGQRFQASLALSLALADESGAGHRFFFIDEGFGSLDDDSLLVVLETLRKVAQEENRLVGLISHVPTIKDEVEIYLNITRTDTDGSKIEIIE
ncbi:MAG: exonuclease subunit SbcD [Brevinema sp.]